MSGYCALMPRYWRIIGVCCCSASSLMASIGAFAGSGARRAQVFGQVRSKYLQHLAEHLGIAGGDVAGIEPALVALEVADNAPRLLHQQGAGGDIPLRQANFPEAVVPTGGDIGQIERGRTRTAQTGGLADHVLEHGEIGVEMAEIAE